MRLHQWLILQNARKDGVTEKNCEQNEATSNGCQSLPQIKQQKETKSWKMHASIFVNTKVLDGKWP